MLWLITSTAALILGGTTAGGQAVVAVAVLTAALLLRAPLPARALVVASMLPLLSGTAAGWMWIASTGALAVAVAITSRHAAGQASLPPGFDLQRHLARCRRLGLPADVVVVRGLSREACRHVARQLRATDSVAVLRVGTGLELHAVVDRQDLDRDGLERRLGALVDERPDFGWSRFPEDGLTLEVLVEQARSSTRGWAAGARVPISVSTKSTVEGSHA